MNKNVTLILVLYILVQRKEKYRYYQRFILFFFSPSRSIGQTGQEQADGAFKAGKVSG